MIERFETATVGEIVATDFRAAEVFEGFGIDFCCGGRRSFSEACKSASADPAEVIRALKDLARPVDAAADVTTWPLDRLIDYIVGTHHAYVRRAIPILANWLERIDKAHGERHREIARIIDIFSELSAELSQHMLKEEQVLFPYIRELVDLDRQGYIGRRSPFGTVENPIRMMEREHREAADGLRIIRELTGGYQAPADGCTTYELCMTELARFERDLHRHVHLENNVLFPHAVALERSRDEEERF